MLALDSVWLFHHIEDGALILCIRPAIWKWNEIFNCRVQVILHRLLLFFHFWIVVAAGVHYPVWHAQLSFVRCVASSIQVIKPNVVQTFILAFWPQEVCFSIAMKWSLYTTSCNHRSSRSYFIWKRRQSLRFCIAIWSNLSDQSDGVSFMSIQMSYLYNNSQHWK